MDITKAIRALRPGSEFVTCDDEITHWFDETTSPPTKKEIEDEMQRLQAEEAANAYKAKRAAEYPDFREYLDGIVNGDQAQIDAYIAACQAIKAKYPKGTA